MSSISIRYGLISGFISVAFILIFYVLNPANIVSNWFSMISFVIPIIFLIYTAKDTRKELDGFMTLNEGFKATFFCAIIVVFISVIFNYILYNVIDDGTLSMLMKEKAIESTQKISNMLGGNSELNDKINAELEKQTFGFGIKELCIAIFFGLIVNAILCLFISLIFKKNPPLEV